MHRFASSLLLTLGFASATAFAMAAAPVRLFEVYAQRFIDDHGSPILDIGTLDALGTFNHYTYSQLPTGTAVPAEAMNRNLFPVSLFLGYDVLGAEAFANFNLGSIVHVGTQDYFSLSVAGNPKLDVGSLLNISTRATVAPGGDPLIGGFVIADHPRRVLLRGVGPALRTYGVAAPLPNPVLALYRQGQTALVASNDNWDQQSGADQLEAAAALAGAFPLPRGSKDASLLIELPPGIYSAQVSTAETTGGTALLEVYVLP